MASRWPKKAHARQRDGWIRPGKMGGGQGGMNSGLHIFLMKQTEWIFFSFCSQSPQKPREDLQSSTRVHVLLCHLRNSHVLTRRGGGGPGRRLRHAGRNSHRTAIRAASVLTGKENPAASVAQWPRGDLCPRSDHSTGPTYCLPVMPSTLHVLTDIIKPSPGRKRT